MAAKRPDDNWVPNPTGDRKRFGDDFGHAFLAVCALVEPGVHLNVLRDYSKAQVEFERSGFIDDLRQRKDAAIASVGNQDEFLRLLLQRLSRHRQTIRFDSRLALYFVVSSIPPETVGKVLDVDRAEKYGSLYESLEWFAEKWLNGSELGKQALAAQMALRALPEIREALKTSITNDPFWKTIMIPGFRVEPTTSAQRLVFREKVSAFATASLPMKKISTLSNEARMFARVRVDFSDSPAKAAANKGFRKEFPGAGEHRSAISAATSPFVKALAPHEADPRTQ
jgi:hypothetical protein